MIVSISRTAQILHKEKEQTIYVVREKERERGKKDKGGGRKENKSKRSSGTDIEAGRELGVGVSPPTQVAAERELQEHREHDPKLHESQGEAEEPPPGPAE